MFILMNDKNKKDFLDLIEKELLSGSMIDYNILYVIIKDDCGISKIKRSEIKIEIEYNEPKNFEIK